MAENRFRGIVRFWSPERCIGKLSVDRRGAMIHFHISEVLNARAEDIKQFDELEFTFGEFQGKLCAVQIKLLAPPTIPADAAKAGA